MLSLQNLEESFGDHPFNFPLTPPFPLKPRLSQLPSNPTSPPPPPLPGNKMNGLVVWNLCAHSSVVIS